MDVRLVEYARIKAFYNLLVDRLGADVWAKRRAAFVERIRAKESKIDLSMPIEPQLFVPAEDDIDWCSGQLIPDTVLSFSSVFAGASPSLN